MLKMDSSSIHCESGELSLKRTPGDFLKSEVFPFTLNVAKYNSSSLTGITPSVESQNPKVFVSVQIS